MRDANEWPDLVKQIEDSMQVSEEDYWSKDRDADMRDAFCQHRNCGTEEKNFGTFCVPIVVCYDCGREIIKKEMQ